MLQKELESIYMERLLWMKQLENDPVHKKIMQTKDAFVENDDFAPEEAIWRQLWITENFLSKNFEKIILLPKTAMMKTIKYFEDFFQIVTDDDDQ
jgi:hypothetical protein